MLHQLLCRSIGSAPPGHGHLRGGAVQAEVLQAKLEWLKAEQQLEAGSPEAEPASAASGSQTGGVKDQTRLIGHSAEQAASISSREPLTDVKQEAQGSESSKALAELRCGPRDSILGNLRTEDVDLQDGCSVRASPSLEKDRAGLQHPFTTSCTEPERLPTNTDGHGTPLLGLHWWKIPDREGKPPKLESFDRKLGRQSDTIIPASPLQLLLLPSSRCLVKKSYLLWATCQN